MVAGNSVRDEGTSGAMQLPIPVLAVAASPEEHALVDFGVGIGFVPALVPYPPAEDTHPFIQGLLKICAESILDRGSERVCGNLRPWCLAGKEIIHRVAIAPHVCVIYESQKPEDSFAARKDRAVEFEFEIFGAGTAHIGIQVDAGRHLWHQPFREAHGPPSI